VLMTFGIVLSRVILIFSAKICVADVISAIKQQYESTIEKDWSSRQHYFRNPRERGLYRVRALLARQGFSVQNTNSYGFSVR
jgi:hypothetical protein